MLGYLNLCIMGFYKDKELIKLVKVVMKEDKESLFKPQELVSLYSVAKAMKKTQGAFAEVGVYKGSTAKMICETKEQRPLYLFDTFDGLPEVEEIDKVFFKKNQYRSNYDFVKNRLSKYPNVQIYKGCFPGTSAPIENERFSFVHLDVDIYKSMKESLEFFYTRMDAYGIILCHDYPHVPGVKKAIDEFFENKPEAVIELGLTQCLIVKK